MLEYDRFDKSKGIGTNKISDSHESKVCKNWYFFRKNFTY